MVTRFLPPVAAGVVLLVMSVATPLRPVPRSIALACVIASFAIAAFLKRKDTRTHGSVVAGIAAVDAAGQVEGGWLFGTLAGAFLFAALYSLREARRKERIDVQLKPVLVTLAFTAVVVALSVIFLPPIAARVERTVTSMLGADGDEATAFSSTMALGSTTGMLQSNTIVARLDQQENPGYLRGAVYDRYDGRYWINRNGQMIRTIKAAPAPDRHRITLDRHAPNGPDMRWFLPPSACGFGTDVQFDAFGVARRATQPAPAKLDYATQRCSPPPVLQPNDQDVEVPVHIRPEIDALAKEAAGSATTTEEKLAAIERSMAGFEYSLAVRRDEELDPIVDFLTTHKAGHCEMFASAMVLEARALRIPARVVGGYHVSEYNPVTKQWVIRDRNAHSWVEAWDGHRWRAYDPTPISDQPGARPGAWARFWDHVGDLWAIGWDKLYELGYLGLGIGLAILVVVLVAVRQLGLWVRRPRQRRAAAKLERPLPCFERLAGALEAKGFVRDPAEPLEAFAARLPLAEAAAAVGAYAALRYGGVGDEANVVSLVEGAAQGLRG